MSTKFSLNKNTIYKLIIETLQITYDWKKM